MLREIAAPRARAPGLVVVLALAVLAVLAGEARAQAPRELFAAAAEGAGRTVDHAD